MELTLRSYIEHLFWLDSNGGTAEQIDYYRREILMLTRALDARKLMRRLRIN